MLIYVPEGDTGTYVTFASSNPHKTRFIAISFMEDNKPNDLLEELESWGWAKDNGPFPLIDFSINGRFEIHLHAKGSGPCSMWTEEEGKTHLRHARRALKSYGFNRVPHRKLTIADMM